jgi:hypothetical protein
MFLVGEKAQRRGVRERADRLLVVARADCLRRVFNQPQPVAVGNLSQRAHLRRLPIQAHGQNRARARGNRCLYQVRVYVVGVGVNIYEHGRRAQLHDHLRR